MVTPAFRIRTMQGFEAGAVARIGFAAWMANRTHADWFLEDVEQRVEASFADFARKPDAEVLVAVAGDTILGWGARDSREHPGDRSRSWNYLSDLWVLPEWQGKGIGSALVAELLARMRADGLEVATIETDHANAQALALYQRLGFTEIGRGKSFSPSLGLNMIRVLLEKLLV
ncbi:GNAT family N-acetyltransferase [Pararhizobium sp.]|uniref:GNAT family N-acetyltransferase n=1 Tax=Pararhizobium sp. TaxID=1977563 RepID=UPI002728B3EC|nr:GNAT family N-acetyltransferase [Pararhizobium sp.]MDO9415881.1 GNAT family N-acetyltransferase [Pararhizobium sp.]